MKGEVGQSAAQEAEAQRWAQGLQAMAQQIGRHFARSEARDRVGAYLRGLLSPIERKSSWQLAEALGEARPYGVQHLLGRAQWDADAVRDDLRRYVVQHLGEQEAVLVLDETGFLKKGERSAGVQRQYSGTAGRIENCQIGVFLAYVASGGRAFIDRELYLPQGWAEDRARCREADLPESVQFATKPQLARRMIERAVETKVPFGWITADEVYGNDRRLRVWLEQQDLPHVMAVASNAYVWLGTQQQTVRAVVQRLSARAWHRLSCGDGSKGERVYEWARVPLLTILMPGRQRWLLVRRQVSAPHEMAYYVVFGPKHTGLEQIVKVAGTRWAIEESFQSAKGEVGLDQYEVRSWHGWYRHITLALLAHAFLTVLRAGAAEGLYPLRGPRRAAVKKARTATPAIPHRTRVDSAHSSRGAQAPVVAGVRHCADCRARLGMVTLAAPAPSPGPALSRSTQGEELSTTVVLVRLVG
jgi:SRSO17 transposase